MAEGAAFHELFGDSDSEDEEFFGFNEDDLGAIERGNVVDEIENVELDDEEYANILREIDVEDHDPTHDAYDCDWLGMFTEIEGAANIGENSTESEIFTQIIDDTVIALLVEETNRYFDQYMQKVGGLENLKPNARARRWKPVTTSEMKAFVALLLYIGLLRLPDYDSYWSTDELISLKGFTSEPKVWSRQLY